MIKRIPGLYRPGSFWEHILAAIKVWAELYFVELIYIIITAGVQENTIAVGVDFRSFRYTFSHTSRHLKVQGMGTRYGHALLRNLQLCCYLNGS